MKFRYRVIWLAFGGLNVSGACAASAAGESAAIRAERLFRQHCESAGEKITRTVDNVEGIFVLKLRADHMNYSDQFRLDDPYGRDLPGEDYLASFLREIYDERGINRPHSDKNARNTLPAGYKFVDANDGKDGIRYRYTGRIEEPWLKNHRYLKGYKRFVMDRAPSPGPAPRYGVDYRDISTPEDRRSWIAGSSLQVIDLQTKEVIAERIGYMFDPAQGNTSGGRSPWLLAANYACPAFGKRHAFSYQTGQTLRFVEKVLHPSKDK